MRFNLLKLIAFTQQVSIPMFNRWDEFPDSSGLHYPPIIQHHIRKQGGLTLLITHLKNTFKLNSPVLSVQQIQDKQLKILSILLKCIQSNDINKRYLIQNFAIFDILTLVKGLYPLKAIIEQSNNILFALKQTNICTHNMNNDQQLPREGILTVPSDNFYLSPQNKIILSESEINSLGPQSIELLSNLGLIKKNKTDMYIYELNGSLLNYVTIKHQLPPMLYKFLMQYPHLHPAISLNSSAFSYSVNSMQLKSALIAYMKPSPIMETSTPKEFLKEPQKKQIQPSSFIATYYIYIIYCSLPILACLYIKKKW